MAQRTVCLCNGKYIGIETIYTVKEGKQINIPEKLKELRKKSKSEQLFCPCGCGSNLVLIAGDRNLREQHFRLKKGNFSSSCEAVIEGQKSINSKIVLKCWLDDKLQESDIESRVQVSDVSDSTRKYEFTFLSKNKKVAISYCNERINLLEEKIKLLNGNSKGISVVYIVDMHNYGNNGQYPESIMKVQNEQGYCLFLSTTKHDYSAAKLRAAFSAQDIDGLWQEVIIAEDKLYEFSISEGKVVYQAIALDELLERSIVEWTDGLEQERVKREEERKRLEKQHLLEAELKAKMREEKARQERRMEEERKQRWEDEYKHFIEPADEKREAEEKRRAEAEQERIKSEKLIADSIMERMNQQEEQVRDSEGRRWIKCEYCEKIALESEFSSYGGINHVNLGICYECQRNNPKAKIISMPELIKKSKIEVNKCPYCGGELKEKMSKFGRFFGCSNYPNCIFKRNIK